MKRLFLIFICSLVACFGCATVNPEGSAVESVQEPVQKETITLAVWNIGHFSGGFSQNSTITVDDYDGKLQAFRDYVYNDINADIIGLAEYSKDFGVSATGVNTANDVLFNDYEYQYVGNQYNYSCNALYSKKQFAFQKENAFDCNKNATITHTNLIKASDYYYVTADFYLNDELVKLVVCHLAFDNNLNPDTINKNQMAELIDKFKDDDKVVMVADWNCRDFDYFNLFTENGYKLANNDNSVATYRFSWDNRSLDNIIYKGIAVGNFKVHVTELSDHYAVSCQVSL